MFPEISEDDISIVGNAAGAGAKIALVSREKREALQEVVRDIRYIELATAPDFNNTFTQAISLG